MNKKFIVSSLVMAFAALMAGFVVHGLMLQNDYLRLPNIFRPESEAQNYFGFMLLAHLLIGIGLTWIYRRGHEPGKSVLSQGLKFGAAMAAVGTLPTYLIYFAVQRLPSDLVAQQIVFDGICILLLGLLVAWLNKS
jgi:drug/metabolite transporter (DMT)-like permease